ncbi:MAG: hypothetical protein WBA05_17125 [Gordonia sp. (in: high G+C Gram-positive bacteria)]|uniref:hypothetical protein n=1 Tax=Gordonia sp. (in: high G+C Gram-positive bacteria) TaxID=84139 RepID=UPI003C77E546
MTRRAGVLLAIVAAALVAAGGAATVIAQHDVHQARARAVLVASPPPGMPNPGYAPGVPAMFAIAIDSYAVLVESETFLRRVIDRRQLPMTTAELRAATVVSSPRGTTIVDFDVRSDNPVTARRAATAIADEFALVIPELERPTPITVEVLAAPPAHPAFPHSTLRTIVLASIAAATAAAAVGYGARRSRAPAESGTRPPARTGRTRTTATITGDRS